MPQKTDRARVAWIKHEGVEMLYLDFSEAPVEVSLDLVDQFLKALEGRPENSVLLLTNVTGASYEPSVAAKWKAARLSRSSLIRASALWGLSGLVGMAIRGFVEAAQLMGLAFSSDQLRIFKDGNEAKDWLCKK